MERIISKISCVISILVLCVMPLQKCFSAQEGLATATMKNFIKPQFNDQTKKLEYILTGTDAKSTGALVQISNVKIELIGHDGETVTGVMTTPLANYNQATNFVNGDREVSYTSKAFDADGVGFDASQVTQTVHIRKNVKLVIKSMEDLKGGMPGTFTTLTSASVGNLTGGSDKTDTGSK